MYKKTRYCIELKEETHKLFSTKTGRLVELSPDEYNAIFLEKNYDQYPNEVAALFSAEILVNADSDQIAEMELIRKNTIVSNNKKGITNYVITPTMACNARCAYCFEKDVHHDTMTDKTADKVADYIIKNYAGELITIHWFGGEPLLASQIIDRISRHLFESNIRFASKITTNGYFLTPDVVEKALSYWNIEYVQVTIDDIGEKYNAIKNYKNSAENPFEIVMDNVDYALKKGLIVRVRNNYDPENFEKPQEIIDYTRKRFHDNPNLIFHMHALFSDDVSSITGRFEKQDRHPFLSVLECEQKCESFLLSNRDSSNEHPLKNKAKFTAWCDPRVYVEGDIAVKILCKHMLYPVPVHCYGICDNSLAIDSHGDIFVCHSLLGKGKKYASGNVEIGIERNEVYKHYQSEKIGEKMCLNCSLLPLCHGGCRFKRNMYNTNQFCIPIKGCPEAALKHALSEIESATGSLDVLK